MPSDTIRAAVLIGYEETARSVGLDPLRLLDTFGIPRAALIDRDMRISLLATRNLMELCGRTAEDFALRMAERRTLSVMGPVALIAREQPTVRGVIEAIDRYRAFHAEATSVPLEDVDDVTIVRVVHAWSAPGPDRQAVEMALALLMQLLRQFLGAHGFR